MTEYKTTIKCDIYMCKHNSACCSQPRDSIKEEGSFCTCQSIKIGIDELNNTIDCLHYEEDYKKLGKCFACQIAENGEIDFDDDTNEFEIIEVNDDNDDGLW